VVLMNCWALGFLPWSLKAWNEKYRYCVPLFYALPVNNRNRTFFYKLFFGDEPSVTIKNMFVLEVQLVSTSNADL
jgi:hypothetical protein